MNVGPSRPAHERFGVAVLLTVAWMAGQAAAAPWDPYERLGFVSLAAGFVAWVMMRDRLRELLTPKPREMLIGLAAGAAMLAATYGGAAVAAQLIPGFEGLRAELYAMAGMSHPGLDHLLLLVVIVGEELLWRALMLDAVSQRLPRAARILVVVLLYAVAQLGSGSWVVAALAVGCGGVWTGLCVWRDNLWPPLISHAIWTMAVLVVAPV